MRLIFTYFLLALFLFPLAEKGIHAFGHEEEEHCAAYEETHLHEKHHDCQLCDYHLEPVQKTDIAFQLLPPFKNIETGFSFFPFSKSTSLFFFSLRAPPFIG